MHLSMLKSDPFLPGMNHILCGKPPKSALGTAEGEGRGVQGLQPFGTIRPLQRSRPLEASPSQGGERELKNQDVQPQRHLLGLSQPGPSPSGSLPGGGPQGPGLLQQEQAAHTQLQHRFLQRGEKPDAR